MYVFLTIGQDDDQILLAYKNAPDIETVRNYILGTVKDGTTVEARALPDILIKKYPYPIEEWNNRSH